MKQSGEAAEAILARLALANGIALDSARRPVAQRFRNRDGLTLHYLDWPGSHETIVFLHGGALTAHSWDLVALALGGPYRCIALDLRGHGLSDWADDYSIAAGARDVEALVDHLGLEHVHVVGMSLGGNIGGHYAALAGARVATLTMVDVGPWVSFEATAGMRGFMNQPIAHLTLEELVEAAMKMSASGQSDKILYRYTHMTHVLSDGSLAWRDDRRRSREFDNMLVKLDELADLAPAMTCRALIVRGGRSRVLTDEKVARFAGLFRDGQWTVIPGAGHNVQEDRPAELAGIVRRFWSGEGTA